MTADLFDEETDRAGLPEATGPSPSEVRAFAQSLLSRREYAVLELRDRLLKKWPDEKKTQVVIEEVVSALEAEDLLSDERFAEAYVRSRLQRWQGPFKINADLRLRRVPEEIIQSVLDDNDETWVELATSWIARQGKEALDYNTRAKLYRKLANRGFSHYQAMRALDLYQSDDGLDQD